MLKIGFSMPNIPVIEEERKEGNYL